MRNYIKTDSRKVIQGDIFVALKGILSDGHDYIEQAISNGASLIVCEHGNYPVETLIVNDTREYLINKLKEEYKSIIEEMTIIGITGTNGKTTTSYLLYESLNKLNKKTSYVGTLGFYLDGKVKNLNNSTPDITDIYDFLIESYNKGYKTMVIEASSQGLSYGRLDSIEFDYAIFTNLTQDHLDYHKTMENYAYAKQLLFKKLKKDGVSIINIDDGYHKYFDLFGNKITYGFNNSDIMLIEYSLNKNFTTVDIKIENQIVKIKTNLIGKFNLYNISAAIAILKNMKFTNKQIVDVIAVLSPPEGRMEKIEYKNNNLIIIDYAHTPDSIEKSINIARQFTKGDIYVVFGCTGERDRSKRPIMTQIATTLSKKAILTIDDPHNENIDDIFKDMIDGVYNNNYEICTDRKEAIIKGINELEKDDTLLILGKGHEEFIIKGNERIPFSDKEEVLNYIKDTND